MSKKNLVDILHILLCKRTHDQDMLNILDRDDNLCYYYLESDVSDGLEMSDHLLWNDNAEGFKKIMNLSSDQEALDFVKATIQLSQKVKELSKGNKLRLDFIKNLL